MKAIFVTKATSAYDDLPEERYHFPKQYLNRVVQTVGDWIIYYEPRRTSFEDSSRGGRQAYFAMARVREVIPDPTAPGYYYALMEGYLPFATPVPFKVNGEFFEPGLGTTTGSTNLGKFQHAVRLVADSVFDAILLSGYAPVLLEQSLGETDGQQTDEPETTTRQIIETLVRRPMRDRLFERQVKGVYNHTCAFTGIKIINGGGRSEVQAAHIRPVADDGPDSIRNGLALSGTMHWMFDRGLISVDDDYSLLLAKDKVPDTVGRIISPEHKLLLPSEAIHRPHQQFLKYHRETVFKG